MRKDFLAYLLSSLLLYQTGHTQANGPFISAWEGKLDVGVPLRIVLHINASGASGLAATMDSPDQSAFGIKCDTVIAKGDSIRIELSKLFVVIAAKLVGDSTLNGVFVQGGVPIALTLKKGSGIVAVRKHPQTPQPPFPYKSEEVEYVNADQSLHYGATITIPQGKGPFPAVLLITGSGPQDRDENVFGHKPFAVIADVLTRNGFVVLRVDDRGVGKSTGNFGESTSADFAIDAGNSFNYLLSRPETDKKKAGLLGHSEGGMIAPMLAAQRKDIAFIILLAGPGIKIDSLMSEQNSAILRSNGVSEAAINAYRPLFKQLMYESSADTDSSTVLATMAHSIATWRAKTDTGILKELQVDEETTLPFARSLYRQLSGKWFRYFLAFDPQPYLQKARCKVLALNGSRDIQVISTSNLAGIESAFKKSGLKTYTIKEMAGLNHLFQTCHECTIAEYAELQETIAPVVLQEISTWLNKNVK